MEKLRKLYRILNITSHGVLGGKDSLNDKLHCDLFALSLHFVTSAVPLGRLLYRVESDNTCCAAFYGTEALTSDKCGPGSDRLYTGNCSFTSATHGLKVRLNLVVIGADNPSGFEANAEPILATLPTDELYDNQKTFVSMR